MGKVRPARSFALLVVLALAGFGCEEVAPQGDASRAREELSRLEQRHPELFAAAREQATERAAAVLPASADGVVELGDASGEARIEIERIGAAASAATSAADWRVYPNGAGPGSSVALRATRAGFEERIDFEQAPLDSEQRYRILLSEAGMGLRQVDGVLELLDAAGTPRLRLVAPQLVGADGERAAATLEVEGCAVERASAPPWGRAPRAPGASSCELRVSWDNVEMEFPAVLAQSWTLTTQLAIARQRFGVAALPGGLVLVAGGSSAAGEPLSSAELYDGASGTWAMTGRLAVARSDGSLSPLSSGRVLAAGGRGAAGVLDDAELYDLAAGRWLAAPPLPAPRSGHAAIVLDAGDVLLAGGDSTTALRYSGSWTEAGELLALEAGATLSALSGGRALLVGPDAPAAQLYDSTTNRWSEAPAPAVPRTGHTATRLSNGRVLIAGGNTPTALGGLLPTRAAEVFEPATSTWQTVGATRDAHVFHTATRLSSGRVLLVGGEGADGSEVYDPAWGTWAPGPDVLGPRMRHGAALLSDGTVLVMGGASADGPVRELSPAAALETRFDRPAAEGKEPEGETRPALSGEPSSLAGAERGASGLDGADAAPPPAPSTPVLTSSERLEVVVRAPVTAEYKLPARLDRGVSNDAVTELWASVTRPGTLETGRRYPLIVALAGNHATCGSGSNPREDSDCSYTHSGKCPSGFSVVASHRGFDYIANELAARGYIVVSVNANRGINCGDGEADDWSMNLARGRLLLRHLERLGQWNRGESRTPTSLGVSLEGKLDFSEVGLLGHSRGGEGARAAYQQYRDADSPWPARIVDPLVFRAIFEIAPVDGQAPRRLDADGVAWAALLPMCDGDVTDMQGVRPFDRALRLTEENPPTPKATLTAWGANHNFFNTQWQESDSTGCAGHRALFGAVRGSAEQRQIALGAALDFFRANLGSAAERRGTPIGARFDPALAWESESRVDRGYAPGIGLDQALVLEDFRGRSGVGMRGLPHLTRGLRPLHTGIPEHDPSALAALLRWDAGDVDARFLELHFAEPGQGLDLGHYEYLDFRVDRAQSDNNPIEPTPLVVQLLGADGTLSPALDVADYGVVLDGPVGGPRDNPHVMLQTVRLPLADFGEARGLAVRGVRFVLPGARGGALFITDVRASVGSARPASEPRVASLATGGASPPSVASITLPAPAALALVAGAGVEGEPERLVQAGNGVRALSTAGNDVEVELSTREHFVVQDAALVLDIGGQRSFRSRHPDGDLHRVIFRVDSASFGRARDGAPLRVRTSSSGARVWDFGPLDKARLQR